MATSWRRWRLAGLVLVAVALGAGCNILTLPFFLFSGTDPKQVPDFVEFTSDDKDKEIKVVFLAYSGVETRPEFIGADNELTELLVRVLEQTFKDNKEKVKIVSPRKVKDFKNNHPDWYTLSMEDIGKHFEADYVVYLGIQSLSLYEEGSSNTLYHGRAHILVSVTDTRQTDFEPRKK